MLAIQFDRTGGPEVLQVVDRPTPEPGEGQVLVRHQAIGLNFIDTYHRGGLYPITLPSGLGGEAAGTVEAIGAGVTRFKTGDRVAYALAPAGAYAEAHCVDARRVVALPEAISCEVAAAGLLKGMTAEFLLHRTYRVQAGDAILVHAAAGGVGSILTQWAKHLGALVIGTAGSEAKARKALQNGCDHVILYGQEDVPGRVRAITGGAGVRVAYDSVGAATLAGSQASLGRRGLLVSFGNASGPPPAVDPLALMRGGSLFLTRPTLGDYIASTEELDASAQALFAVIASGDVRIEIGQTWPLREVADAHRALEGRRTTGSTVLIP